MRRFLQICPHDVAPFGELCDRYAEAASIVGAELTTVFIAPPENEPRPGAIYLSAGDMSDTRAIAAALEAALEGAWELALCHRYRAYWSFVRSRLSATKVVAIAHEYGMMARWQRRFNRRLFARRVRFAGVADGVAEDLAADLGDETMVLPNTLAEHHSTLSREVARQRLGVASDCLLIGFVGRLHYKKRPNLALQAFRLFAADHPEAQLIMVGDGEEFDRIGQQTGNNVTLTGFVEDAPALFPAFDVLLSTTRYEAFGMAVLEAMAAGVPVVARRGDGPEYVLGELGDFADNEDAQGFAAAIPRAMARDPVEHARRCEERLAKEFSPRALARALERYLSD